MRELTVVVGGQYGSEGKGAVVGHIARRLTEQDLVIRVGGPNAGHTVVDDSGQTWKLRQLPAATPVSNCQLAIAAGSEIDIQVLAEEIDQADHAGIKLDGRLRIHPAATILTQAHQSVELGLRMAKSIGSTGKGVGAARADRIMRSAATMATLKSDTWVGSQIIGDPDDEVTYLKHRHVVVEGTQGYGLGLHTTHYPYATSGDCTAIDFLAQARISPWVPALNQMTVWVVARVYPIRVAGNSGPLFGETTWERLGLPPEHTTVTNKIRRVGSWDSRLVGQAVQANGGHPVVQIALMMADQLFPEVAGVTDQDQLEQHFDLTRFIEQVEDECNARVGLVGTGPSTCVWIRED
jgi:adenylosuccinate synthase